MYKMWNEVIEHSRMSHLINMTWFTDFLLENTIEQFISVTKLKVADDFMSSIEIRMLDSLPMI